MTVTIFFFLFVRVPATTSCANRGHYACMHYNDRRVFFIISHSMLLCRHQHFIFSNDGPRYRCVVHICTGNECAGRTIPVHDDGDGGFLLLLQLYQELLSALCPTNTSRRPLRHQGKHQVDSLLIFWWRLHP